jgi:uncharacterized protein (TIGR03083 family)
MDTWDDVAAGRRELADELLTLTPKQWETPSLCDRWKVRDVVGHVIATAEITLGSAAIAMIKSGFRIDTMLEREARRRGAHPTDDLIASLRDVSGSRRAPPGQTAPAVLSDLVVHTEDIRRPLGLMRPLPQTRARVVADHLKGQGASFLPAKRRIAGLRLVSTNADWSTGSGAEVRGPIESLVMAMAGRKVALADLTGDGVDILMSRL